MSETTAREAAGTGTQERGFGSRLLSRLVRVREVSILIVLVGLALYFQTANSAFLSQQNILSLAQFAVPYVVIASALCLLLICGEIDLSVGQSFAFAPIVMYLAYDKLFLVLPLAVLVGLLAVAVVGLINGLITVYLGVSSLITTLGMFFLLAGLNVTLTGGFPATTPETSSITQVLGESSWAGTIWALIIVAVLQLVLSRTRWGLHTYATGGNPLGAREAGVSIARIKIGNFILCGILGGFVGIIESFRINSIDPLARRTRHRAALHRLRGHRGDGATWWGRDRYGRVPRGAGSHHPPQRLHPAGHKRLHLQHHPWHRHPYSHDPQRVCRKVAWRGELMMENGATNGSDFLRVEGVVKNFGAVSVLKGVDLHVREGEVLGLIGDNGAGKSTLLKTITGFHRPDEGRILLEGEEVNLRSVSQARSLGIQTVYQDLALINELSVFHNMFLNGEMTVGPFLNNRKMKEKTSQYLQDMGVYIPSIDTEVARLSGGQRQAIAVARAVYSDAKMLLLDEPLAAMGAKEGALILDLIQRLKEERGIPMILIVHNYAQVFDVCDRVNLLRNGRIEYDKPVAESSVEELTELVVSEYRKARETGNGG